MAVSWCRCWSGEHLPLGLLAIGALIIVVMGLPFCTLVAWHRHARDVDFEAVEASSNKLQQQIFHRGDYEVQFYWVRHAGWAVLVLIGILDTICPVWLKSLVLLALATTQCYRSMRRVQASIGRDVGVAVVTSLYMGLFLWLRPFRKHHRSASTHPLHVQAREGC